MARTQATDPGARWAKALSPEIRAIVRAVAASSALWTGQAEAVEVTTIDLSAGADPLAMQWTALTELDSTETAAVTGA